MPHYVDGFIVAVKKNKLTQYKKLAQLSAKLWKEHGALSYRECVGEDLQVKFGRPFPKLVKPKPDETIFFSWIEFKSRAHRDKVNAKVMQDERLIGPGPDDMPLDPRRMSYGGFEVFVASGK